MIDVGAFIGTQDGKVRVRQALGGNVDMRAVNGRRGREEDGLTLNPFDQVLRQRRVDLHSWRNVSEREQGVVYNEDGERIMKLENKSRMPGGYRGKRGPKQKRAEGINAKYERRIALTSRKER